MSLSSSQHDMPWQIRLFGNIEMVSPDGVIVRVTGRRTGQLLAYLALHPDRSHARDNLTELI